MKHSDAKTVLLGDYTPPSYLVSHVHLRFDLDEHQTLVSSIMQLRRNPLADGDAPLILNADNCELLELKLNGVVQQAEEYFCDAQQLRIDHAPDQMLLQVKTRIFPQKNSSLMGLYQSSGNFCTQCEAEGFRKITFYPDRPDVLAKFSTTIVADAEKFPVMLSNGNLMYRGRWNNGRHWATWPSSQVRMAAASSSAPSGFPCRR